MNRVSRWISGKGETPLTALEKKERVKKGTALVLAFMTCVVAYVRFGTGDDSPPPVVNGPNTSEVPYTAAVNPVPPTHTALAKVQMPLDYDTETLRDIFHPEAPPRNPESLSHAPGAVPTFKLTGIVTAGADPVAMINNRLLRIGDQLDGYRLVKITNNSAILSAPDHQTELKVLNQNTDP